MASANSTLLWTLLSTRARATGDQWARARPACSHPVLARLEGCAERPQGPVSAPRGQEE